MSEEQNLKVNHVNTLCKNCVFSQWDKNTQTGCKLNKIKDYEAAGIEVFGVDDDGKKFFLINGRFCVFYRNEKMMGSIPKDNWEQIVKLQTKVPYHAMLIVEADSTFAEVKRSLIQLKEQNPSPNLVSIINKQYINYSKDPEKHIAPSRLLELLSNSEFHQFSLKNIYDEEMDDRALIDLVYDNVKDKPLPFYVTFKAGFDIPKTFSEEFNNSILIKMMQMGFVKGIDDTNGMIVNKTAHKKHGGNSFGIALEDKILKFEENGEKFIYEIGDVCPSMKK